VNAFDLGVLVVAVLAALGGWRLGFVARVFSWLGLAAGLYVAARFLPRVVRVSHLSSSQSRLILAIVVLLGGAFIGQALGIWIGGLLHNILPFGPVRQLDRLVGAVVGVGGVLVALWLLLPALASAPGTPARLTANSVIARWVNDHGPRPPNTLESLRHLVGSDGFPQVFDALRPGAKVGAPPAADPITAALTSSVGTSTVKVEGEACDRIQDGSGWVVAPDLVVTNAHVVAGEGAGRTEVRLNSGATLGATVVLFDPNRDLALLSVPNLGLAALPVATGTAGEQGAVFGHPNGQDALAVQPATIAQEVTAVGQDLYDTHTTDRDVFILAASLAPGDSGGALVDQQGQVVGIAFAIAPDQPNTAYALSTSELRAVLGQPHSSAVATGACLDD
jgi:S1-C subfamily serine protease